MTDEELLAEAERLSSAATKPIESHPGYAITCTGRVFSWAHNWRGYGVREMRLTLYKGYLRVRLTDVSGKRTAVPVHKLVAAAFLPQKPSELHQLRHLNGDLLDNRAVNIAWGTARENAVDRDLHGRTATGKLNGQARLTEEKVVAIKTALTKGSRQKDLAAVYAVHPATIWRIAHHKQWVQVKL